MRVWINLMETTKLVLIILIFIFGFQGIRTLIALLYSLFFLEKNQKVVNVSNRNKKVRFFILIPCLNEQNNIKGTLEYLNKICKPIEDICSIYAVTTEKEKNILNEVYTWDVIRNEISNKSYHNVFNLHYPKTEGGISHQLNYAINSLRDQGVFNEFDYIVIYNADSRPHPDTFNYILNDSIDYDLKIYQQYSAVLQNFKELGNSVNGLFLKTFAVFQTRFSLAHEIPRSMRTLSSNTLVSEYSNAHCIGHGFFIPFKIIESLGKFSENTMTEDLFLGFLIRSTGHAIKPIPYLENIISPKTISSNLYQKYIWYWGPMYYPYYYWYYKNNFLNGRNSFKSFVIMLQGILSATAWSFSGPILLFGLIFAYLNIHLFMAKILFFLIFIYAPLQYLVIVYRFEDIIRYTTGRHAKYFNILDYVFVPILSVLIIIVSSLPTFVSMFMEVYSITFGKKLTKNKTEN